MRHHIGSFRGIAAVTAVLAVGALSACGGAQVSTPESVAVTETRAQAASPEAAEHVLNQARLEAVAKHGAVLVVLHADWCQPCNELQFRFLETHDGKAVTAKNVLVSLDFDEPLGGAVASRLHVLGLPTTLVLRPEGNGLREFGRVEGFDLPETYRAALTQALGRTNPAPVGCANADDRPLDASRPAPLLAADLECLAMQLTTDRAEPAAVQLHKFLDDPDQLKGVAQWPEDVRARLLEVVQSLGRFDARVAQDQKRAAALFGSFVAWSGTPAGAVSGLVFWQARSLAKAGDAAGAERVLDAYLARENGSASARLLAADLMVHERVAPERAKRLLADLLAADPGDHWAHYLAGDLATQLGDRENARKHFATANQLKPGVALYIRHYMRLSGDTTRVQ